MTKILVPIDSVENDYTLNAVREAIDLASKMKEEGAELTFLHVEYVEIDLPKDERERLVKAKREEMQEEFEIIKEECQKEGISGIKTMVREGKADEEIVEIAEGGGYDLIVMGSGRIHDRSMTGRMEQFLYGSITEKVIHETPCSILITRLRS